MVGKKTLLLSLFLLSLGGLLLHLRIHAPWQEGRLVMPLVLAPLINLVSLILVIICFSRKETAELGYLLNGLTVILGIILMSQLSLENWPAAMPWYAALLNTTLADSLLLLGKFMAGKALFELYFPERSKNNWILSRTFRFLNNGWWALHFVLITAVYSLGHLWLGKLF